MLHTHMHDVVLSMSHIDTVLRLCLDGCLATVVLVLTDILTKGNEGNHLKYEIHSYMLY